MQRIIKLSRWLALFGLVALVVGFNGHASADANSRYFPETGHTVTQPFLTYWNTHGSLAQQGYPITDDYMEVNDADGHTYRTQYFQRSRFEYHPEQANPAYQVLLGLLGTEAFTAKYPGGLPAGTQTQVVPGDGSQTFPETGHTVTGLFLDYWNNHGGLAQQGYPITEAYFETNDADGNQYVTQYFQRARFEYHPEQSDPQYKVLLGLVGTEIYLLKHHGGGGLTPTATPAPGNPTPTATPISIPAPVQASPADGTVLTNFPRSFTVAWNPISGVPGAISYNVQIEINTGTWVNYHTQTGIAGTSYYSPDFTGDNQGRWRVWATTSQGDGPKSGWWHFSFNTAPVHTAAQYSGTWLNDDSNTGNVTKLTISNAGNSITVHGYGSCHPTDCDWGTRTGTYSGDPFVILFDFGGGLTHQLTMSLDSSNQHLAVIDLGSSSGTLNLTFHRETAADFDGTWLNDDTHTGGITKLILSHSGNDITVHGYGACSPTDCDWGTRTGTFSSEPFAILFDFGGGLTHTPSITVGLAGRQLVVVDTGSSSGVHTYYFHK